MASTAGSLLALACIAGAGCFSFDHRGVGAPVTHLLDGHAWTQTTTAQGERASVTLFALRDETSGEVLHVFAAVHLRDPGDGRRPLVPSDEATLELEGVGPQRWSLGTHAGAAFALPPDELPRRQASGWAGVLRGPRGVLPVAIPAKQIRELLRALAAPVPRDAIRFDVPADALHAVFGTREAPESASR